MADSKFEKNANHIEVSGHPGQVEIGKILEDRAELEKKLASPNTSAEEAEKIRGLIGLIKKGETQEGLQAEDDAKKIVQEGPQILQALNEAVLYDPKTKDASGANDQVKNALGL